LIAFLINSWCHNPPRLLKNSCAGLAWRIPDDAGSVLELSSERPPFDLADELNDGRAIASYRCPAGKRLSYCGTRRASQVRVYRSHVADCAGCELKSQCTIGRKRSISRLVGEDARDTVRALAGTNAYVHARRRRQRIERVFGHLKRNLWLRTLKLRGLSGATEEFTMAAAAYNLQLLARQVSPA